MNFQQICDLFQTSTIGYYGARWYDPALGRFTQADTIVPDPTDARQYDRYAYVSNNPLKYTDPTGHQQYCVSDGESVPTACGYGSPNGGGGGGRAPRVGAGMGGIDDMEIESRPAAGGMSFFGRVGNGFRSVGNWVKSWFGGKETSSKPPTTPADSAEPGAVNFMGERDLFYKNAQKRSDVNPDGFLDVTTHGNETQVEVTTMNGKVLIDHRTFSRLMQNQEEYTGQPIRLLSCSTGACTNGFAQNLANKLNTTVRAPSDTLWAHRDGTLTIGPSPYANTGSWVDFVPKSPQ